MNILVLLVASVVAGILPMICWAVVVAWFDRYEKEPFHLLLISFLWGVAPAVILSAVAEVIVALFSGYGGAVTPTGLSLFNLGLIAPVVEEGVKLLGLIGVFWIAKREVDGPLDGIIYGAMVGFGFAATENFLFFLSSQSVEQLLLIIFVRVMVFGSMHAMFTSFSGLGLAFAKYARPGGRAVLWAAGGYLAAVVFHGLHNLGIVLAEQTAYSLLITLLFYGIGTVLIVMLAVGSLIRERRTVKKYLQPYVELGVVHPLQWQAAASMRSRLVSEWQALSGLDFKKYRLISRIYTVCAELAFKEKQRQLWGEDPKTNQQIDALAAEIRSLSAASTPMEG